MLHGRAGKNIVSIGVIHRESPGASMSIFNGK